jgi:photosynthetic reaction center cytochrome c subunit
MSDGPGRELHLLPQHAQSFKSWEGPPQRTTAWHGIRMARDLNNDYMVPLTGASRPDAWARRATWPRSTAPPATKAQYKPLYGAQMAKDYPALMAPAAAAAAAALPPPVAEALRSVLYFGVGSPTLEGEQAKGLAQLIDADGQARRPVASISGYHSAAGTWRQPGAGQAARLQVRDAIWPPASPTRVKLHKPVQAEANLAGEDPGTPRRSHGP